MLTDEFLKVRREACEWFIEKYRSKIVRPGYDDAVRELQYLDEIDLLRKTLTEVQNHRVAAAVEGSDWKAKWHTAGNYTANDDTYPTEIEFGNGRVVRVVERDGRTFLSVLTPRGIGE